MAKPKYPDGGLSRSAIEKRLALEKKIKDQQMQKQPALSPYVPQQGDQERMQVARDQYLKEQNAPLNRAAANPYMANAMSNIVEPILTIDAGLGAGQLVKRGLRGLIKQAPQHSEEILRGPIDWADAVNRQNNPYFDARGYENQLKSPYQAPITGEGAPYIKNQLSIDEDLKKFPPADSFNYINYGERSIPGQGVAVDPAYPEDRREIGNFVAKWFDENKVDRAHRVGLFLDLPKNAYGGVVVNDYMFAEGGQVDPGKNFLQPNSWKLPQGYKIPFRDSSTELASSIGGENGEPAYLIPTFKHGHPLSNPYQEYQNSGDILGGPWKTWEEADKWEREVRHPYVEKGQTIPSPYKTWGEMAEGGQLDDPFTINDTRKIDRATGLPITDRNKLTATTDTDLVKSIVQRARKNGLDPTESLAMAFQETSLRMPKPNKYFPDPIRASNPFTVGAKDEFPGGMGVGEWQDKNGGDSIDAFMALYKNKLQHARNDSDASRIQSWNGYGNVKDLYGVKGNINMGQNPVYGKRIMDIKENIIAKDPTIQKILTGKMAQGGEMEKQKNPYNKRDIYNYLFPKEEEETKVTAPVSPTTDDIIEDEQPQGDQSQEEALQMAMEMSQYGNPYSPNYKPSISQSGDELVHTANASVNPYAQQTKNEILSTMQGVTDQGIWGNRAHQQRKSDHNTGDAWDAGIDAPEIGETLVNKLQKEAKDKNIKYIIYNGKIWNPSVSDQWRPYNGSDSHTSHVHVSYNR